MLLKRLLILPLLVLLGFYGCRKGTSANWDVDAVAPVLNSVLNITNFIPDTIFKSDNTGLLHLRINREVAALKLDSVVGFPDTTIVASFTNPLFFDNVLQPGAPITPSVGPIKFDFPDGITLKTILVKEGLLKVQFSNDLTEPLDLLYILPTVTKNGQVFTIKETIPPGKHSLKKDYDISGYDFNLRGTSGNVYNTLAQTCTLSLSANANTVVLKPAQGATVEINFDQLIAGFVEGYFGQPQVDLNNDTAKINLLKNFTASNFMLNDVKMDFTLINEFGVDFAGSLNNITARNIKNNQNVVLNNNQLSSINVNRATRTGTVITSKINKYQFNKQNSNIVPFISLLPDMITYNGWFKMNPVPPGNVSGYNDFAYYNTGIRILADIDIPMRFTADRFQLTTTSDFEFSGNKALDGVNGGQFNVYSTNGFPFTAQLQAYMLDGNGNKIDSIFIAGKNTIPHGLLNANNEVTEPMKSTMVIPVSREKIEKLSVCKKLKIVSTLLMPANPPDITIYEKYELGIKITAEVNYNVDLGR